MYNLQENSDVLVTSNINPKQIPRRAEWLQPQIIE